MTAELPHEISASDTRQQEPGDQGNVANSQGGRQSATQRERGQQLSPTGPCWPVAFPLGI